MAQMKFAFSTVSCPGWDFETVVSRAKEYGYDGVEIRGFLNESVLTASNLFLSEPAKVRRLFEAAGIQVACLSSSIAFAHDRKKDAAQVEDFKRYLDAAGGVGCETVKIFDTQVKPGQSRNEASAALGDWLLTLGDLAAEAGICLVVENALSFRTAKEIWSLLDRVNHPAVGACWDLFNAVAVGESPYVSVPTLNSRILYAHVKDAKFSPQGAVFTKLGEGEVPIEKFLTRLRGIGYGGWVTVEWEKAWLVNLAEPEEILPGAIQKLKEWTKPPLTAAEKKTGAKAKAVAKA